MKYAILIYGSLEARQAWQDSAEDHKAAGLQAYADLNHDLSESGELVTTEALADPSLTRHVTIRDGQTVTGDGPYAEVKELLAGFYVVDCDSIERAVEIAGRIPELASGRIEVRPVMTYSELE